MSNKLENAKVLIIGGVGFIGSFLVKEILKEPVKEVILYDNFQRGKIDNIEDSLKDPRCTIFPYGGDIREVDILDKAMEGVDYVFHLAAMWLLHCKDFPRTAFDVNIAGNSFGQPGSYYGKEGFGHIKGNKNRAVPGLEKYHGKEIFLTEALTLEANTAITSAKEEGKPFFLYMAHYAVHAPFHSDPRFAKNYKDSGKSEKAQAYATLIEGIDKSLGDIVAQIKSLGLGENTIILFLGDNGSDAPLPIKEDYSSSEPLKGKKGNHWEGGMRVPFIASWTKVNGNNNMQQKLAIPQNSIQTQMGTIFDVFSTVCALADIKPPKDHKIDGITLHKQLEGKRNGNHPEVFLNHFPHAHRTNYFTSLVKENWKVIYHYQVDGSPRYELFDLEQDPLEANDLRTQNPKKLKKMMQLLVKELQDSKALYPEKDGKKLVLIMPK